MLHYPSSNMSMLERIINYFSECIFSTYSSFLIYSELESLQGL